MPIPVAARSKTWVCGRSFAGIMGSNTAGGVVFISSECCVLSGRGHCVGLITRRGESYGVWCVWMWWQSPAKGGHDPESGRHATEKRSEFGGQIELRLERLWAKSMWVITP